MQTAKYFNKKYPNLQLKQPLISSWVKHEEAWQAKFESDTAFSQTSKQICQTQHPEVMEMLDLWVSKAMADQVILTGEVLCQKWQKFADLVGIPEDKWLKLSDGWLSWYKTWMGLKAMKCYGEAGSAALTTVAKEQTQIQGIIEAGSYELWDVFNTDEGPFNYV